MVNIFEPELVKEILTKNFDFKKPKTNPLLDYLFTGVGMYEGEKWTKHRKLINPAFHMEKLKVHNYFHFFKFFLFFFLF